jgi:hypothetical protein
VPLYTRYTSRAKVPRVAAIFGWRNSTPFGGNERRKAPFTANPFLDAFPFCDLTHTPQCQTPRMRISPPARCAWRSWTRRTRTSTPARAGTKYAPGVGINVSGPRGMQMQWTTASGYAGRVH